jgi:lysophospholipase L1-like esterase
MLKNKKIILILPLVAFWVASLSSCAKREIKNIDTRGSNIICFGDSITFGHGANRGEDYPTLLAKMTKFAVINAGVDDDTSQQALKRISSDVLERDPMLVVIEFGGNDFLTRAPISETINNLREMIDKIQAKGAMVAIFDISTDMILHDYGQAFYNLALEKQAIFIPGVLSGILTDTHLKSDYVHPNKVGYQIIAHRIYRYLIPYLNQNTLLRRFKK